MSNYVTVRFQQVSRTAKRRIKCAGGCGKTLVRQTTFVNTINPFNKNADGIPKTYAEVWRDLGAKCDAWQPTATCKACEAGSLMTTTTVPTVAERVQAGAAYLDEHEPGWVDRIDLETLDINSQCQCILGQLHGSYRDAPPVEAAADADGSHYGVLAWAIPLGFGMNWNDCITDGRKLTAAWRELISARRAGGEA